jgi:cell division protein FtsQ
MKKLKILLIWIGITGYLGFGLGFVSDKYRHKVCERISVKIIDSLSNSFVTSGNVMDLLLESGVKILGYPHHTIQTRELEKLLNNEAFIKNAELYKTIDGVLHADILQRKPIMRVINQKGQSYYLDKEGVILPVSANFTSRVLVANGYISEPFLAESNRSIFDAEFPKNKRNEVIYDLYDLAAFIDSSDLWKAQITQIFVNSKYEYEMIPRVGAHVIYLGDISGYDTKFKKLKAMYRYGMNSEGWNNYEMINLKYENQVVCTKR